MPRGDNNQISRFKPGVSPNPGGRPKLDHESKELLRKNSAQAIRLMHTILLDPAAFGKDGWIPPKDQLKFLDVAMTRVLGRPDVIAVSHQHTHGGSVTVSMSDKLREIADKLPERMAQRSIIDAKVVEIPDRAEK